MLTFPTPSNPPEVFISYSHEDEALLKRLERHLNGLKRAGLITLWHGRKIFPGEHWEEEIDKHLSTAQIILLLVSVNFLDSDYCYGVEFKRAMERHEMGAAYAIPVILSPCDWRNTPLGKLHALPTDAKPVTQWTDRDEAFLTVTKGIRQVIEKLSRINHPETGSANTYTQNPQEHGNSIESITPRNGVIRRLVRLQILREAIQVFPAVKYALLLAGIAAAVAIVAGFSSDYKIAVFGTVTILALVFGLVWFSSLATHSTASIKPLALIMAWIFVVLTAVTSLCISMGFFISWPQPLKAYVDFLKPTPVPTSTVEPSPTSTLTTHELRIVITEVPPYDPLGGRNSRAHIAGKVLGARPEDYSIVIYSLTNVWYVQPTTTDPKTQISPDGTWRADIHSGTRYAILLVPRTYEPPDKTSHSPTRMSGVVASEEIEGKR